MGEHFQRGGVYVKMKLILERFPMDSLEHMRNELARHAECVITINKKGTGIIVSCDADVVKCMEVIVITNLFTPK